MYERDKASGRTGCLCGDALEDIIDERVEDGHRLVRNSGIRVDLLEDYN